MSLWAAKWSQTNQLDGHREHLILFDWRTGLPSRIFKTRSECRTWIEQEYGYIRERPDLRAEPHCWKGAASCQGASCGGKMMLQRTPEWYAARLGRVTASRIADVCARTKTGWGASRANYAAELIVERITGQPFEGYMSKAMQNGIETEPEARAAYEFRSDCAVEEVGFVQHPGIAMAGASPDGYVGSKGLIEIKCPLPATHLATLKGAGVDQRYQLQMQFQMATTGREWCDFVSYCPVFPERWRFYCVRGKRDDRQIAALEKDAIQFLTELDADIEFLNQLDLSQIPA